LRAVTDPAAERQAVGARQHQVEDDEARPLPLQQVASGVPVAGLERRGAFAAQVLDDGLPDRRLVVDDQNGLHSIHSADASPYETLKSTAASKRHLSGP